MSHPSFSVQLNDIFLPALLFSLIVTIVFILASYFKTKKLFISESKKSVSIAFTTIFSVIIFSVSITFSTFIGNVINHNIIYKAEQTFLEMLPNIYEIDTNKMVELNHNVYYDDLNDGSVYKIDHKKDKDLNTVVFELKTIEDGNWVSVKPLSE